MRVVGIDAVGDSLARVALASRPQRLEIRDGAARGQVAEVLLEPEHRRDPRDDLLLHLGGGRAAVECVVIRVDEHGGCVAEDGRRMRGLEHLAHVARVTERVVVAQSLREFVEGLTKHLIRDDERGVLVEGSICILPSVDRFDTPRQPLLQIGHDVHCSARWLNSSTSTVGVQQGVSAPGRA